MRAWFHIVPIFGAAASYLWLRFVMLSQIQNETGEIGGASQAFALVAVIPCSLLGGYVYLWVFLLPMFAFLRKFARESMVLIILLVLIIFPVVGFLSCFFLGISVSLFSNTVEFNLLEIVRGAGEVTVELIKFTFATLFVSSFGYALIFWKKGKGEVAHLNSN